MVNPVIPAKWIGNSDFFKTAADHGLRQFLYIFPKCASDAGLERMIGQQEVQILSEIRRLVETLKKRSAEPEKASGSWEAHVNSA